MSQGTAAHNILSCCWPSVLAASAAGVCPSCKTPRMKENKVAEWACAGSSVAALTSGMGLVWFGNDQWASGASSSR
jgi:hypothetical protein